jgi:hypothetical protein
MGSARHTLIPLVTIPSSSEVCVLDIPATTVEGLNPKL